MSQYLSVKKLMPFGFAVVVDYTLYTAVLGFHSRPLVSGWGTGLALWLLLEDARSFHSV